MSTISPNNLLDPMQCPWVKSFEVKLYPVSHLFSKETFTMTVPYTLHNSKADFSGGSIRIGSSATRVNPSISWQTSQNIPSNQASDMLSTTLEQADLDNFWWIEMTLNGTAYIRYVYFGNAQTYTGTSGAALFPEQANSNYSGRKDVGVCFSGGGTRSLIMSMGQMRFLEQQQYKSKIGYYSCVSGGSWASTIYTYAQQSNADSLLGAAVQPTGYGEQLKKKTVPQMAFGAQSNVFQTALFFNALRILGQAAQSNLIPLAESDLEALGNLGKAISKFLLLPYNRVWVDSVGMAFFMPNGLFDLGSPTTNSFTLDSESASSILGGSGSVTKVFKENENNLKTVMVRDGVYPPYLVINSLMLRPQGDAPDQNKAYVGYEYTPLYQGPTYNGTGPFGTEIKGNASMFSYGADMVGKPADGQIPLMFQSNAGLPSLTTASGTSSSAYAGTTSTGSIPFGLSWFGIVSDWITTLCGNGQQTLSAGLTNLMNNNESSEVRTVLGASASDLTSVNDLIKENEGCICSALKWLLAAFTGENSDVVQALNMLTPGANYFSPEDDSTNPTNTPFSFGDAGLSDNFGLISLLRRGVNKVVVFVNSEMPFVPASGKTPAQIDASVAALFGIVDDSMINVNGIHLRDMQVFRERDFQEEVLGQFEKQAGGKTSDVLVAKSSLTVQSNSNWDLEGGQEVEVIWYYNCLPDAWVTAAGDSFSPSISEDNGLGKFPFYSTVPSTLAGLDTDQINMLANLAYWNVETTADKYLNAMLGVEPSSD